MTGNPEGCKWFSSYNGNFDGIAYFLPNPGLLFDENVGEDFQTGILAGGFYV